jgi:hypothetical protein
MSYSATWLPDAIRDMGVEVVEVDGWQNRGHGDVDPMVYVSHHTADGPNGRTPSLGIVINGAAYTAPGPLANILQSREDGEGNDKAYIVAAGTSYNAGTGGWNGVSGNSHTIGNEIEHVGTEPIPQHRVETACRIAAGCLKAMGRDANNHCQHWEWSWPPGSKIDVCCGNGPNGKCDGDEWRELTRRIMEGTQPTPSPPESHQIMEEGMRVIVGPRQGMNGMVGYCLDGDQLMVEWNGHDREVFGMQIPSKVVDFMEGCGGIQFQYLAVGKDPNVNDLRSKVMQQIRWPGGEEPENLESIIFIHD